MNKDEAVTDIAQELEQRAKHLESKVKNALGDKGQVTMTPTNYTLKAQRMMDEALVEIAYRHCMNRFDAPQAYAAAPVVPPSDYVTTNKAKGHSVQSLQSAGWTIDALLREGMIVAAVAPAPCPR